VLLTLTKRSEFLALRDKGKRIVRPNMVVQMFCREQSPAETMVRVGFTATKVLGGAVVRNRVKRRLRAVARTVLPVLGKSGCDYVLIGRNSTARCDYSHLLQDLQIALDRLHAK
jgi:ribonuclease P protein component